MSDIRNRLNKYINNSNNNDIRSRLNNYINSSNQQINSNEEKEDKSLLKTASAGLQYLGQGALRGLESVFIDTPLQIAAGTRKLFGDEEGSKGLMEASDVSLTNMLVNKAAGKETNPYRNNNQNLWNNEVDKNSYIKENNLGGKIVSGIGEMLPTIGIGSSLSGGLKAKQVGSNVLLGTGAFSSGTNEAYRESGDLVKSMLYGLGNAGTELLTEKISGGIPGLKQIGGTTKKEIAKNYLKSALGEGVEEVISSLANPILQTTYKGSEALNQYGTSDYWKGVLESGIVGSAVGGILDAPNAISNVRNTTNSTNTKNTPKTVYDLVQQEQNSQNSVNLPIVDNNGNIVNSNKFQYVKSDNTKVDNLRKSANKYFNNSAETQNLVNTIEKIIADKDYNVVFDDSIKNKKDQSVNAQITTNKNGEIEIKINPNSPRTGEFLLTHEITHAIETDSMKKLIIDYASKNSEFNQALESLKQTYGTDDVSSEVVADISGQLFGNQEFINSLSMEQPSIFKKIYNKIIELANKITGNSREALFIRDLKNKWENAYRTTTTEQAVSNLNSITQHHISQNASVDIDNVLTNINERNPVKLRDYTPSVLVQNGIKDLPMYENPSHIRKNILTAKEARNLGLSVMPNDNYHGLGKDLYLKTIDSLDNPRVIFKNKNNKDYLILTTLKDNSNNNIVVPIEIETSTYANRVKIDTNRIKSVYGRKNLNTYIKNNINQKELIKIYEQKKEQGTGTIPAASSFSDNNIPQSNNNVKSDIFTKYSMQENKNNTNNYKTDSVGRTLTKQQQEYFKDSKVRDENGNLQVVYHGSPNQFTQFSYDYIGSNGTALGKGFYLTDSISMANGFTGNGNEVMELYANITKPLSLDELTINKQEFKKFVREIAKQDEYWIYDYGDIGREGFEKTLNYAVDLNYDNETNDVDLIHGILNTTTLGWENGFRVLNKTLGYDGIIKHYDAPIDQATGESNVYVPFFPEQIKNVDNSNPTSNRDIRYSQNNQNWQDFLEKNYRATGTRTDMRKLLPTQEDIKKMELSNIKLPIKEARKLNSQQKNNYVESKITKILNSQSYKAVNKASKAGQNYLYFNNTQKRNFKEKLMKYVGKTSNDLTNAKTWNEVKELVKEYANKDYIYVDEELKSVKNQVRSMNIKITDDLKRQITDYNDFRKENFGKLKLGNNGNTIDSIYQELSEQYPYYFGSAETQADMLYELSDFMNKDINIVEKYQFDDAYLEETTAKIFNNLMQNTLNEQQIEELRANLEDKLNARTREVIQEELMQEMGITLDDISKGKDISSFDLSRTDPIRVNEKIFGAKVGDKINDATIRKTQANEASRIRFLNKERNEIKKLGIKAFSKESEAVQKYGEKQYINDKGDIIPYGDKELIQDFPDIITQQKIKKAAEVIRNKYDTYIDQINNVLVDMGYDAIKKRKDYMRHFQALNDVFSRFGVPLNAESLQSDSLPTDINGLTDQFKPGKQYFASAMQRIGMRTAYDAITGIDGYLEGASNLIYHTEDIQRYRALSKFIRNTYGAEHGFENVDKLTLPQQEQRIQDIQSNKLAKYVSWLDEQANALANKKGKIDRGVEEVFGRKVYQVLETAKKQVGSNMVGFNIRSALTNFASVVQGASKTNKIAFLKGTISTINNMIHKDNLVDKSDFLTRRFGSDQLSQKLWQKATNAGFALMTGTDYFTANQIWRSKYYEYLDNGLSENMAIKGADDFASRIMGDRSKGSTATLFNSKTLGFFTQFQLEVNNQWSTMIHDNKMDLQRGNKTASSIVFQLGQLFAMSYLFNNLMESLTGSDVMLDPIELLKMLFNPDDEEEDMEQRATKVLGEVVNNIPFASIFTGGRIPVGEAFGGVSTAFKYATGQTDDYGNNYEVKDVANDMIESAFYWILPTGFSQLNKTRKGLSMYDENLPVKGSYTESGNLRFTADESFGGKVKATLFGQYSSKESQDYIESGFKTIPKGKINEMKSLEMNSTEYRKYREELANAGKTNEEKLDYISGLKLPISKKNIMANNVVNSDKYQIDMSKYGDFSSYEEMQMYYTNPSKYSTIAQITTYAKYQNYNDAIKDIKEQYEDSNQRKYSVINYVNGLNLSVPQKAMLIKLNYSSFKDYDNQIIEYINSQNMTIAEKTTILEQLGFTVRNGRVYS